MKYLQFEVLEIPRKAYKELYMCLTFTTGFRGHIIAIIKRFKER